jgi:hypothetical protein
MWLYKWRLKMAPEKCNYSIFTIKNHKRDVCLKYKFFNVSLTKSESTLFLGYDLITI